jgi:hypothetical protein
VEGREAAALRFGDADAVAVGDIADGAARGAQTDARQDIAVRQGHQRVDAVEIGIDRPAKRMERVADTVDPHRLGIGPAAGVFLSGHDGLNAPHSPYALLRKYYMRRRL